MENQPVEIGIVQNANTELKREPSFTVGSASIYWRCYFKTASALIHDYTYYENLTF